MSSSDTTVDKLAGFIESPIEGDGYTSEKEHPRPFRHDKFSEFLSKIEYGPVDSSTSSPTAVNYVSALAGIESSMRAVNVTFFQIHGPSSITANARGTLRQMPDGDVRKHALRLLDQLDSILKMVDASVWPKLWAFDMGDGSLVLEWIAKHWRIGFSIETNEDESAWYLVSDKQAGDIQAYGSLRQVDVGWLANWVHRQMKPLPLYA